MADEQRKSEVRWWLRTIVYPLGIVGVLVVWLGWHSSQQQARTLPVAVLKYVGFPRRALLNAVAHLRQSRPVSITVEVRPIAIPEAADFVPTFDEFLVAIDQKIVQKIVLHHGENQRIARIELDGEGFHNYSIIANQHEAMGPDTQSPGNPGHSTFEGSGSIVLHNNAKYLIVVGGGTSFKDRVSIREIN